MRRRESAMRDSCFESQCASFFAYKLSARTRFFHTHTRTRFNVLQFAYTTKPQRRSHTIMFETHSHTSTPAHGSGARTCVQPTAPPMASPRRAATVAQYTPPPCCCRLRSTRRKQHTQSNKTQQAAAAEGGATLRSLPVDLKYSNLAPHSGMVSHALPAGFEWPGIGNLPAHASTSATEGS